MRKHDIHIFSNSRIKKIRLSRLLVASQNIGLARLISYNTVVKRTLASLQMNVITLNTPAMPAPKQVNL